MTYIAPARKARKIASRIHGKGLDIFASVHVTCERIPDRLAMICDDAAALDQWMVATIYRSLIAKTATQDAPRAFYSDATARRDDDCYYAVAEIDGGHTVCIVFAMAGSEVTIITVLRPLAASGATYQRGRSRNVKPLAKNAGGLGRVLPAHRRAS